MSKLDHFDRFRKKFDIEDPAFAEQFEDVLEHLVTKCPVAHSELEPGYHVFNRHQDVRPFSAQSVKKLEPRLQEIANRLIDACSDTGEVEFVSQFAQPFPLYVFAELMGLPEADIPRVKNSLGLR